jgi:hypothetical protein
MPTVRSRVWRILRRLKSFQLDGNGGSLAREDLPAEEAVLGVYLNEPPFLKKAIVVTAEALLVESEGGWAPIHYASIAQVVCPEVRPLPRELRLVLHDGSTVNLPVLGGTERASDVFEFVRFLDRILSDRQAVGRKIIRRARSGPVL